MPKRTLVLAREAIPAQHDTERCAWWKEPCEQRSFCQDLCQHHYNRAWWAGERAPKFSTTTLDAIRSQHALTEIDDEARTATCSLCGPVRHFYWSKTGPSRPGNQRRSCAQTANSQRRRRETGWGEEEYDLAVIAQGNRCAICGLSPEGRGRHGVLQADHCHASEQTRKLLCGQCNHVLGLMGDDPVALRAAAAYLEAHA